MTNLRIANEKLEARLSRLESRNRLLALLFVSATALLLLGGASPDPAPGEIEQSDSGLER